MKSVLTLFFFASLSLFAQDLSKDLPSVVQDAYFGDIYGLRLRMIDGEHLLSMKGKVVGSFSDEEIHELEKFIMEGYRRGQLETRVQGNQVVSHLILDAFNGKIKNCKLRFASSKDRNDLPYRNLFIKGKFYGTFSVHGYRVSSRKKENISKVIKNAIIQGRCYYQD